MTEHGRGQRWVRVQDGADVRFGRVVDEDIRLIAGSPFDDWRDDGRSLPLAMARLLAPVIPPTFYACGINYAGHATSVSAQFGNQRQSALPRAPEVGYRAQNAIIGPGEAIVIPPDAERNVQCEGELAVVIGRSARRVKARDAVHYIFGYTIANDVSARDWQFTDRTFWRSKNSDTFKPLGPWIATDVDPGAMRTRVRLNGRLVEEFATGAMLFSIGDYIEAITRYITLHPGDVIMMGTNGQSPEIRDGDSIAIEIEGIGTLTNPVLRGRD